MLNISIGIWLCLLIMKLYSQKLFSNYFRCGSVKTTHYGTQSIKYLAPKIWDFVPDQIKHCGSLTKFKHFIKSWSPSDCPCGLCKTYITQVGFGET